MRHGAMVALVGLAWSGVASAATVTLETDQLNLGLSSGQLADVELRFVLPGPPTAPMWDGVPCGEIVGSELVFNRSSNCGPHVLGPGNPPASLAAVVGGSPTTWTVSLDGQLHTRATTNDVQRASAGGQRL